MAVLAVLQGAISFSLSAYEGESLVKPRFPEVRGPRGLEKNRLVIRRAFLKTETTGTSPESFD